MYSDLGYTFSNPTGWLRLQQDIVEQEADDVDVRLTSVKKKIPTAIVSVQGRELEIIGVLGVKEECAILVTHSVVLGLVVDRDDLLRHVRTWVQAQRSS